MSQFDSSITAYFGGDISGLQQATVQSEQLVTRLEARYAEMGISMGSAPQKFAEESAKAFEEVFSGEQKLREFQQQTAFDRMSNEGKLKVLAAEALSIREQALSIEGNTVEKQGLLLQYEQKKSQIYGINQQLIAESADAQKSNASETEKTAGFAGALEKAAGGVKKAFKEMGIDLKGAGMGIIFAEVVNLGKQAVENAMKQRDEYEKIGKPLDASAKSLAAFGDGLSSVKKAASSFVGSIISGWAQIGDLIGSGINRMRGINEAQENYAQTSQRLADLAEARVKKLKEEQHDVDKVAAAAKNLEDARSKAAMDAANDEGKFALLAKENVTLREQLQHTEQGTVLFYERQQKLLENSVELNKQGYLLAKQTADAQMDHIKNVAPLDITYADKTNTLMAERKVLIAELAQLQKGSVEYKAVEREMEQNLVSIEQLRRDNASKRAMDESTIVELIKIRLGLSKLDADQQAELVEKSAVQVKQKQLQQDIEERTAELIAKRMNPLEDAKLQAMIKQSVKLDEQAKKTDLAYDAEKRRNDMAKQYGMISDDQLGVMEVQVKTAIEMASAEGKVTDELQAQLDIILRIKNERKPAAPTPTKSGGQLGLHDLGNTSTDVLMAKQKELQDQMDALVMEYQRKGYTGDARSDNYYLQSEIDSIAEELRFRQDFTSAFQKGGRAGALSNYVQEGRDALSFDTALSNMGSWNKGLDVLQENVKSINNTLKNVFG